MMTIRTSHISRRGLMAAAFVAGFAALGATSAAQAGEKLKLTLVFPTDVTTFELPYFVPQDTGWYAERGLEVKEVWMSGDANALRTVIAGDGDICAIGVPTTLSAIINGAEIAAIGSWQPVVDYQIVGKKGVVGALGDLPGKTLSSAAPKGLTTELPKMVLKKHGMNPDDVKFLRVGGHSDRLKAVAAGKTQAAMINTLTATKGTLLGEVEILTALAQEFPGMGYVLTVANKSALADPEKRKALEIFVEGNVYGARYIMENPDKAAELLHKRNPELDLGLIKSVVPKLNEIGVWGVNGGASTEVISYTANLSADLGMTDRKVAADEVLDHSISEAVLKKVGKLDSGF